MTQTRTLDKLRSRVFAATSISLMLLAAPLAGCGSGGGSIPTRETPPPDLDTCQNLQPPAGHRVAFRLFARGVQIYRWNGTAWAFQAPEATLYGDAEGRSVAGGHYAGPTWEATGGSKVVGTVRERCSRSQTIPWLLLQAGTPEGRGMFDGVTYIQRVNTTGGNAPTEPGTVVDQVARVPYTTDYFFYQAETAGE